MRILLVVVIRKSTDAVCCDVRPIISVVVLIVIIKRIPGARRASLTSSGKRN